VNINEIETAYLERVFNRLKAMGLNQELVINFPIGQIKFIPNNRFGYDICPKCNEKIESSWHSENCKGIRNND